MENLSGLDKGVRAAQDTDLKRVSQLLEADYDVIALIGSGGMGNVYFGRSKENPSLEVAIKVLHPEYLNDPTLSARFLREAELLRKVQHPGIVSFYDAKCENGIAYYVMECVVGTTLEKLIQDNSIPLQEIPTLIIRICEALHSVHSVGIIHRDLKPANILVLDSFDIKLTDFGIARPENSQLTHHNEIVGSVCYIAPEIWIGEEPGPSVDLYSLGIVMYELLTGKVPFDGSSPGELMRKHLQIAPSPPKDLDSAIPSYLSKLTISLLSKSKHERPKDALAVIDNINKGLGSRTSSHSFSNFRQDTEEFLRTLEVSNEEENLSKQCEENKSPKILSKEFKSLEKNEKNSSEPHNKELSLQNNKISLNEKKLLYYGVGLILGMIALTLGLITYLLFSPVS